MPLLNYLGQAGLFLACLYGMYWLFFRKEVFHQLNRALLLLIMAGTLALPLAPAPPLFQNAEGLAGTVTILPLSPAGQQPAFNTKVLEARRPLEAMAPVMQRATLSGWLSLVYFTGLALLSIRLVFQLFLAFRLLKRGKWQKEQKGWLVSSDEFNAPFSFWNIIFLPASLEDSPLRHYILEHERVHQRQWHSADLLLAELFCIAFWFHPAAWWLNRALRARLEHIADEAVLNSGVNRKHYQYSLLSLAGRNIPFHLANQFNQSLIKTRIVMMNAKKSPAHHQLKYLTVLPLVFLLVLAFNDARAQATEAKPAKETVEARAKGGATASETGTSATKKGAKARGQASVATSGGASAKSGVAVGPTAVASSGRSSSVTGIAQADGYESVFVAIGAEFPAERLPQMKKDLEEQGILLNVEELDYNSDKLITRLKLTVRTKDGQMHGNGFSYNDGQPIDEPVIFYVRRDNGNYGFGIFTGKLNNDVPAEVRSVIEKMENGYFVGKIITE